MSDEIVDDDIVVDESQQEEEVEFVEDTEDAPEIDVSQKLSAFEKQLEESKKNNDTLGAIKEGFGTVAEKLDNSLRGIQQGFQNTQPKVVDPDEEYFANLTDQQLSEDILTKGKVVVDRLKSSIIKQVRQEMGGLAAQNTISQGQMFLEMQEQDPTVGHIVKKYKAEIEAQLGGMDARFRGDRAIIKETINMVAGRHLQEILADKEAGVSRPSSSGSSRPAAPTVSKGGGSVGAVGTKKQVDVRKLFPEWEYQDFVKRGFSKQDMYDVAKNRGKI
jgi:hypothetical protein